LDLGVKIRKVLGVICKIYKIHKNKTRLQGYSGGWMQNGGDIPYLCTEAGGRLWWLQPPATRASRSSTGLRKRKEDHVE
jgi:hypothetical protein